MAHSQDSEDTTTAPSNVTTGSITRGQNDVWSSNVPLGPSKKYLECKKLLANELNSPTPATLGALGGSTGYHLTAASTPAQSYARAGGLIIFVCAFFFVVGIFKYLTGNVLKKGVQTMAGPLVVIYSEISVFSIIGLLGFIILRLDTLPKYSVTFLPGQGPNTMTVMFENIEITMFMFIIFYTIFGLTLIGISLNISDKWALWENGAAKSYLDENNELNKKVVKADPIQYQNQVSKIAYLCLRDDFLRSMPGKVGLRGPDNALLFDFSRYLTLRLSTQLKGILKITLPQFFIILFACMFVALASAFPLVLQLVLAQLVSWSLVLTSYITRNKLCEMNEYLNRGIKGRGVKQISEENESDNATLTNNSLTFNKMLNNSESVPESVSLSALSRQDNYFYCGGGKSGNSYTRGVQRGLLLGNALIASLQIHLCFRAVDLSYGWLLGVLAFAAASLTVSLCLSFVCFFLYCS